VRDDLPDAPPLGLDLLADVDRRPVLEREQVAGLTRLPRLDHEAVALGHAGLAQLALTGLGQAARERRRGHEGRAPAAGMLALDDAERGVGIDRAHRVGIHAEELPDPPADV